MARTPREELPGQRLSPKEERMRIRAIREHWGGSLVNYFGPTAHAPAPLWSLFSKSALMTDQSVFSRVRVAGDERVYLYTENPYPGFLHMATFAQIKAYFATFGATEPRNRYYVLPTNLTWGIAYSDDDTQTGHLVLLDGVAME